MRVWDIHPGYLSNQSLLGQHAEIHAIYNVISQGKKGYSSHPETLRWCNNLNLLVKRHNNTVKEMLLRGYNHKSPLGTEKKEESPGGYRLEYVDRPAKQFIILWEKYAKDNRVGRIPLPKTISSFWAQHKYSVMARGYQYYKEIQQALNNRKDLPVDKDEEFIALVHEKMEMPTSEKALGNVMDHLWGYFKKISNQEEREIFFKLKSGDINTQLNYLYSLAIKYNEGYLLQSTVFADVSL